MSFDFDKYINDALEEIAEDFKDKLNDRISEKETLGEVVGVAIGVAITTSAEITKKALINYHNDLMEFINTALSANDSE